MNRKVFLSFQYEEEVGRTNVVKETLQMQNKHDLKFIRRNDYKKLKEQGLDCLYNEIDRSLEETSVTVVLIGQNTFKSQSVNYSIMKSLERGNSILGIKIHSIKDFKGKNPLLEGELETIVGYDRLGNPVYFNEIAHMVYDYKRHNGAYYISDWIESAVRSKEMFEEIYEELLEKPLIK